MAEKLLFPLSLGTQTVLIVLHHSFTPKNVLVFWDIGPLQNLVVTASPASAFPKRMFFQTFWSKILGTS